MGKNWKQWQILFSWSSKSLRTVTAAMKLKDSCSLEKKSYEIARHILKSRDITLLTKVCLVKAMVFPVVMYWVPKNWCFCIGFAMHQHELWCWKRLLRGPWAARRSNKSILKKINSEYSLKGLMLKLQHFGHLIQRANLLQKALMLGKIEVREEKRVAEGEMVGLASLTQWTWV